MNGKRLLFPVTAFGLLFTLLIAMLPLEQPQTELALNSAGNARDLAGRIRLTITGAGFDRHTRLLLTPEFGNRRALLQTFPTWGTLQGLTVAGDLLYLANYYRGLHVLDFSNPARPRQIGTLQLPGTAWRVAVNGTIACVTSREEGLQVVDIGDPRQLRRLGAVTLGGNALDVAIAGNRAYVANSKRGLQVVDLTEPANARLLATLAVPGTPCALAVEKGIVYLAAVNGGLQIVDARDHRQLRHLGFVATPEPTFDVAVRNGIASLAAGRSGFIAIDVRNPRAPKRIGAVDTPGTARGIALAGKRAYLADNKSGLQVVDIADPRQPFPVGAYDLPGRAQEIALNGQFALVASGRSGLQVIDLRQPATPPRDKFPLADAPPAVFSKGKREFIATGEEGVLVLESRGSVPPAIVGRIPIAGVVRKFQVAGDFLYALSLASGPDRPYRIEAIDIGDLDNPRPATSIDTLKTPKDLLVVANNLWVTGNDGLCRFDLADPASPRSAGCLPLPGIGESLAEYAGFLLVGDTQGSLHLIDATDPETPRRLGTTVLPWHLQAFAASAKIETVDSLAVVAGGRNGLLVYSIEDPRRPELLGGVQLPEGNYAGGVSVAGHTAYVSDVRDGLHLIDFSDPRQLQLTATIRNQGSARQILLTGEQIVFFTEEEGLCAFPVPLEPVEIEVESDARLTAVFSDPIPPGSYTLWAYNGASRAELPGSFRIEP